MYVLAVHPHVKHAKILLITVLNVYQANISSRTNVWTSAQRLTNINMSL